MALFVHIKWKGFYVKSSQKCYHFDSKKAILVNKNVDLTLRQFGIAINNCFKNVFQKS